MDLRELKNKFIEANTITDNIKVIFRLPDCKSCDDCHCHIAKINDNNVLVVDLIYKIEPKFKVGDIVTNISGLYPNVKCTITTIDKEKQCYYFREINGTTSFKDQDKLMLVKDEEVRPPVEDSIKLDGFNARFAKNNVLTHNLEHYPLIRDMINIIIKASNEGKICHTFIVPHITKNDTFGVYYNEDEICGIIRWHFDKLDYNIKENVNNENNYVEFIISW